jgi:hypothetical protein
MERVNGFPVFLLGANVMGFIGRLEAKEEWTFNDLAREGYNCFQNLTQWATDKMAIAPLSKNAAYRAANAMLEFCSAEHLKDHGTEAAPDTAKNQIKFQLEHLVSLLAAELNDSDLYFVSQKRGFKMPILIFAAEQNLDEKVIELLPPKCTEELREAGRCLAFDLPTASGFHIFRTLEIITLSYFPVLGLRPLDDKMRNLGNYIKLLKGETIDGQQLHPDKKIDIKITGVLDHLRENYRNPLMHPELTLDDTEAQDLFNFALSVISMMIRDIQDRKPKPRRKRREKP